MLRATSKKNKQRDTPKKAIEESKLILKSIQIIPKKEEQNTD